MDETALSTLLLKELLTHNQQKTPTGDGPEIEKIDCFLLLVCLRKYLDFSVLR